MNLIEKEFLGKVLSDSDPNHQGRYKIHVPDLMHHISEDKGIWFKNHTHKNRITPSKNGNYGQYFPLQPETFVMVKFYENDYNTGYVDRIISDYELETLPLKIKDRDDFYQLIRTPKYNNIFTFHEDTTDEPPNSIHLYYNTHRTTLVIDEEGIHIHSDDNKDELITKDVDKLVKQNQKLHVKGNYDIYVEGETKIYSSGTCDVRSATTINCDAPIIHLNCGIAQTAEQAEIPERKYDQKSKSNDSETHMILGMNTYDDYDFFDRG